MKVEDKPMNNNNEQKSVLMFLSQDTFFLSHFEKTASLLTSRNWKVVVLARQTSEQNKKTIENLGYRFVDSGIKRAGVSIIKEARSLIRTISIVKALSPTVIHNYGLKSIIYGTIARILVSRKTKVINNLTGLGAAFIQEDLKFKILRIVILLFLRLLLNPKGSKVIFENNDDLKIFTGNRSVRDNDACLIRGAGVNTEVFNPLPWSEREGRITVVMTARLLYSKGVVEYFEAAKILTEKGSKMQFWIIGDIDEDNPNSLSEKELEVLKRCSQVKVLGKRTDVQNIIKKCHICVLPSYREGLPLALIEGAACGLAIVATDTVGCRELVQNKNGLLCKVKDSFDLARCLEELEQNPLLLRNMGTNSRELALKEFANQIVLREILKIYEELVGHSEFEFVKKSDI